MTAFRARPLGLVVALLLALAVVAGCSKKSGPHYGSVLPTDGSATAATLDSRSHPTRADATFYPLDPGDHWTYVREDYAALTPLGDTAAFRGGTTATMSRTIDCDWTYGSDTWRVQTDRIRQSGADYLNIYWTALRQDRTGLYELEVIPTPDYPCGPLASASRSRAAMGASSERMLAGIRDRRFARAADAALERLAQREAHPLAGGLPQVADIGPTIFTRLRYPLSVGETWSVQPLVRDAHGNPLMTATVEARQRLLLPAGRLSGYRIRIRSAYDGPNDSVVLWYGRAGYLGLDSHYEFNITDDEGTVIGTGWSNVRERLTDLQLAGGRNVVAEDAGDAP